MTRLAENRDTHLTPEEIAVEALRQFDSGAEPSIRGLAAALKVAPSAIYHHYPSRAAVVQASIDLVWQEANAEGFELMPDASSADPAAVLLSAGLGTRRAWLRHHRLAPYMAATADAHGALSSRLSLIANLLAQLELEGEAAAAALHAYASFTFGSALFAAARLTAAEDAEFGEGPQRAAGALEEMLLDPQVVPQRDEELFALGLQRVIESFAEHRRLFSGTGSPPIGGYLAPPDVVGT